MEWNSRALASLLARAGHAVVKAHDEAQARVLLARLRPDVVFLGLRPGGTDGAAALRRLRAEGRIEATTPVIGLVPGRPTRAERLTALKAGAWDVVGLPFDGDALLLQVATLVRAKQAADALRDEALLDPDTGLYSSRGVLRRLNELRAAATRRGGAMACIVVGPRDESDGLAPPRPAAAERLRGVTRASDAHGSLADDLFVVVAPDTDRDGALRLAHRIVARAPEGGWVAGLFAEDDLRTSSASAADFLSRATEAFRSARTGPESTRIFGDPRAN